MTKMTIIIDIEEVGFSANQFAELSCRTECNFNDLRLTFNDLNISFLEILEYIKVSNDELPFARRKLQDLSF